MFEYQTLECEKYWVESAKKEIRDIRRQQNREATSSFMYAVVFTAMLGGIAYGWNQGVFENWDVLGAICYVGETATALGQNVQQMIRNMSW